MHQGAVGTNQETSSEDEPHILRHSVKKPIYQEIREIISPYRKIFQRIEPVQQEIKTIVARNQNGNGPVPVMQMGGGNGYGNGMGGMGNRKYGGGGGGQYNRMTGNSNQTGKGFQGGYYGGGHQGGNGGQYQQQASNLKTKRVKYQVKSKY